MDEYKEANLAWWNEAVGVHTHGDGYGLAGFRAGNSTLKFLERDEVGAVAGKSLLHLQCHFGLDTLSWARLGAEVTGVDFSANAIELARLLADQAGLNAAFVQSDIHDLPGVLTGQFDIVYTSYGVIWWLPDLMPWGRIIAHYLKPGGFFYIAEAHPFMGVFDDRSSDFRATSPYFSREPIKDDEQGSYADGNAKMAHTVTYGWNHTFSEILTALLSAGLRIDFLHEFPFCAWKRFPDMVRDEHLFLSMRDPAKEQLIPMTFSLKATKPL